MLSFEVRTEIAGSPEDVWAVLTESARLDHRGSGIVSLEGTLGLGETVRLISEADPKRTFELKVTTFDPHTMILASIAPRSATIVPAVRDRPVGRGRTPGNANQRTRSLT